MAAATALIAGSFYALGTVVDDRLAFASGTLGNANELSMVLLLGAPFFLVPVFSRDSSWFRKLVCLALCGVVLVLVIKSASRSNLLAIISILAQLLTGRLPVKLKLGLLSIVPEIFVRCRDAAANPFTLRNPIQRCVRGR